MRPIGGVIAELAGLVLVLDALLHVIPSSQFYPLIVLIVQALTTVLVHCPAHYFVGRSLGIRFSGMKLARSTLVKALPPSIKSIGSLLIVPSLAIDKESRRTASPRRMRAMYLAGVSGSVGAAITLAILVSFGGSYVAASAAWLFSLGYLISDVALSPRSGDLMRARAAGKSARAQERDVESGPTFNQ